MTYDIRGRGLRSRPRGEPDNTRDKSNFESFVDWMQIHHLKEFRILLERIEEWLHH